ncbi:MAG: PepSY domain-containing protein, partial [Erysipelotrichaceae bacterium]
MKNKKILIAIGITAIILATISILYFVDLNKTVIVNFDTNPSIQIKIKEDKVVDLQALNDDGKRIFESIDFKNMAVKDATNKIVEELIKNEYLISNNSILIGVDAKDTSLGEIMKTNLVNYVVEKMNAHQLKPNVLSLLITNKDNSSMAAKNNISLSKAQLITEILQKSKDYSFEQLSKLNINELNLLTIDKKMDLKINQIGEPLMNDYITRNKAFELAMKKLDLKSVVIVGATIEFDEENDIFVYEVNFAHNNRNYEVDVNAKNGEIVSWNIEPLDKPIGDLKFSKNDAIEIALKEFKLDKKDVKNILCGIDDGQYEVEFLYDNKEYEIRVDVNSGKIISKKADIDDNSNYQINITASQAVEILSKNLNIKRNQMINLDVELEKGIYEIEFSYNSKMYKYYVNANTKLVEKYYQYNISDTDTNTSASTDEKNPTDKPNKPGSVDTSTGSTADKNDYND